MRRLAPGSAQHGVLFVLASRTASGPKLKSREASPACVAPQSYQNESVQRERQPDRSSDSRSAGVKPIKNEPETTREKARATKDGPGCPRRDRLGLTRGAILRHGSELNSSVNVKSPRDPVQNDILSRRSSSGRTEEVATPDRAWRWNERAGADIAEREGEGEWAESTVVAYRGHLRAVHRLLALHGRFPPTVE